MTAILDEIYADHQKVVVTAHRGFSSQYPENTLLAFNKAFELGANIIEFDIRASQEGTPIILHDETLDRTTNATGYPEDHTLTELKEADASYWAGSHDTGKRLNAPATPGEKIPTFEELCKTLANKIGMNIQIYSKDIKTIRETCELYKRYDLYRSAYMSVSTYKTAEDILAIDPAIELCILEDQGNMSESSLIKQKSLGCKHCQPLIRDVTPELCNTARKLGLRANMFFSNTDKNNKHFIAMGIQGILTDYPDILMQTLANMA